jgi:hypothetical protein
MRGRSASTEDLDYGWDSDDTVYGDDRWGSDDETDVVEDEEDSEDRFDSKPSELLNLSYHGSTYRPVYVSDCYRPIRR